MFVVSDVHGAWDAFERIATAGERLLILGDLVNLIDYRTIEGIIPDVVGAELVAEVAALRGVDRYEEAGALWRTRTEGRDAQIRSDISALMEDEYIRMNAALSGANGFVTYGNVDSPEMLRDHLPASVRFVDAEAVDIDGERFGFAGGGVAKIGSRGEVSDAEMVEKLKQIGPVDVLCTHVPPAVPMLAEDVIGGSFKGSQPILAYIDAYQPRLHYFGDVHQPRATRWSRGATQCINVGYFRATGRPHVHG
ncbi:MAG: metallophosphoesterase family protein [Acidimicrobiia bacterium]